MNLGFISFSSSLLLLHSHFFHHSLPFQANIKSCLFCLGTSLVAQMAKRLSAMWETWVQSLGWEGPLEKEMAIHSSTLVWTIPWTEEPGRLQSIGPQRVRHDWSDLAPSTWALIFVVRWLLWLFSPLLVSLFNMDREPATNFEVRTKVPPCLLISVIF